MKNTQIKLSSALGERTLKDYRVSLSFRKRSLRSVEGEKKNPPHVTRRSPEFPNEEDLGSKVIKMFIKREGRLGHGDKTSICPSVEVRCCGDDRRRPLIGRFLLGWDLLSTGPN